MSVAVMSQVFKRYPVGGGEYVLALALADHADDDGCNIWPAVSSLAEKTRQSERSVQYQLRHMEKTGWLVRVSVRKVGRGQTVEYRINQNWLKGAEIAPFVDEKGCNSEQERVQSTTQKGAIHDIVYKEEPSGTINEPSACAREVQLDTQEQRFVIADPLYDRWLETYRRMVDPEHWSKTAAEAWLETELAKAANYILDPQHPKRTGQYRDWKKFLTSWLNRAITPPAQRHGRAAQKRSRVLPHPPPSG